MPRYIDADALRKKILDTRFAECYDLPWNRWWITKAIGVVNKILEIIKKFPAADVEEVKHSKWEEIEYATSLYSVVSMRCNKCDRYHNEVYTYGNPTEFIHYCPHCGARMDGKGSNE